MATKTKTNQTSTPREFFQRLYGDLENDKDLERTKNYLTSQEQVPANVVTPIPLLAAPLPFPFPTAGEAHFTAAAAAGLTAFRELKL